MQGSWTFVLPVRRFKTSGAGAMPSEGLVFIRVILGRLQRRPKFCYFNGTLLTPVGRGVASCLWRGVYGGI